ncbi:MAG: hypothetical protein WC788_02280 [Candidatus Paceibacterota bacterium]
MDQANKTFKIISSVLLKLYCTELIKKSIIRYNLNLHRNEEAHHHHQEIKGKHIEAQQAKS